MYPSTAIPFPCEVMEYRSEGKRKGSEVSLCVRVSHSRGCRDDARGIERTEAKQGVEPGERDDPFTYKILTFYQAVTLRCRAAAETEPRTLNADGTATARAPGLRKPINFVTRLRVKQRGMRGGCYLRSALLDSYSTGRVGVGVG